MYGRSLTPGERALTSRSVTGCRMTADADLLIPGVKRQSLSGGHVDLSLYPGKKPRKPKGVLIEVKAETPRLSRTEYRKLRKQTRRTSRNS
jgi:hypothetical protein